MTEEGPHPFQIGILGIAAEPRRSHPAQPLIPISQAPSYPTMAAHSPHNRSDSMGHAGPLSILARDWSTPK